MALALLQIWAPEVVNTSCESLAHLCHVPMEFVAMGIGLRTECSILNASTRISTYNRKKPRRATGGQHTTKRVLNHSDESRVCRLSQGKNANFTHT